MTLRKHFVLAAVMFCTVIATVVSYDAVATRTLRAAPTAVATIDLGRVLDGLEQRSVFEASINQMRESILTELRSRQADLQSKLDALKNTPENERRAAEGNLVQQRLQLEEFARLQEAQMDIEAALGYENIYKSIRATVQRLADQEGYDLVVVDDSVGQFQKNSESEVPRALQILRQVRDRRVLFARDAIDITDQLVTMMNNEYKHGG